MSALAGRPVEKLTLAEAKKELERLAGEIEEDRETLLEIMRTLGVRVDRIQVLAGWGAEKLGRLTPSLQALPSVVWTTTLSFYLDLTLQQILQRIAAMDRPRSAETKRATSARKVGRGSESSTRRAGLPGG